MDDTGIEVFISSASEDYPSASEVFRHLSGLGIRCFFSEDTLDRLGQTQYKQVIESALEECRHLILVTSSRANAEKKWVQHEWQTFDNECLSSRKDGNLITLACLGITPAELPWTPRNRIVLRWPVERDRLISYVGRKRTPAPVTAPIAEDTPLPIATAPEPEARLPEPVWQDTIPNQSSHPAKAHGPTRKRPQPIFRMLAWIAVYYWRPPFWPHDSRTGAPSGATGPLWRVWDFLLRCMRLWMLGASTYFFSVSIVGFCIGLTEPHRTDLADWVCILGNLFGTALILWIGWLSSGPLRHQMEKAAARREAMEKTVPAMVRMPWWECAVIMAGMTATLILAELIVVEICIGDRLAIPRSSSLLRASFILAGILVLIRRIWAWWRERTWRARHREAVTPNAPTLEILSYPQGFTFGIWLILFGVWVCLGWGNPIGPPIVSMVMGTALCIIAWRKWRQTRKSDASAGPA